ncbi:MAG: hypothetical protein M1828_006609 [Chrysothrix sp. TS-e1954]|nr:MAG: hypothetical protein M1828_006609 [Chrysothrix sp. TS-e1954]
MSIAQPDRPNTSGEYDQVRGTFTLDDNVTEALPIIGTKVLHARKYGQSLWNQIIKIITRLPDGSRQNYLLKVASHGSVGRSMMEGEYESLKAIHTTVPNFTPEPYAWGNLAKPNDNKFFLLLEFKEVGLQPPNPVSFTTYLSQLHERSVSPTGKFGFHTSTCNGKFTQYTDCWYSSWAELYGKQFAHQVKHNEENLGSWPVFYALCKLLIDRVVPRLLVPLQSSGRVLKPCLVHGNLWDENTATDMTTGEPFIFDASSFYGHNEYEIGNWRALRRRLGDPVYMQNYKRRFPVSEPRKEWNDRNLLYSLKFDCSAALQVPGSRQRQQVMRNVTTLCEKFFPLESTRIINQGLSMSPSIGTLEEDIGNNSTDSEEEEEEPEEEEEE